MARLAPVLLAVAVSACSTLPAPVGAQEAPPEPPRTVEVSASASVTRTPDQAVLRLAVLSMGRTAQEAMRSNAETMTAVLAALTAAGIDESAIGTDAINLSPRYRRDQDAEEAIITGYQATNMVSVRVDVIERVGAVVDAAIDAGANRVAGITFRLADPEAAYHEALEQAVADARRQAEVLARALGETLGPALHVSTDGGGSPVGRESSPILLRAATDTPVQPGEIQVRASVHITYRLGS